MIFDQRGNLDSAQRDEAEEVRHASQNADSAYPFCIACNGKKGMLKQHFVTQVVPPLGNIGLRRPCSCNMLWRAITIA